MTSSELREIVYHCECRRFVQGTLVTACICHECGREHSPLDNAVVNGTAGGL